MQEEDKIEQIGSLPQLREDLPLQKIAWKIQKVCWVIIVAFMLLIALGLFGNGPLSKASETKNNITLEYERFSRRQASIKTTIRFTLPESATSAEPGITSGADIEAKEPGLAGEPASGTDPVVNIRIPVAYLSGFELETVFPESYESKIEDGALLYSFPTGNSRSLTIHFFTHPQKPGIIRGNWTVNGSVFPLTHVIYP